MPSTPVSRYSPPNSNFEEVVRESFNSQGIMRLLGATLETVEAGRCTIHLPFNETLSQQDGFFHAGATSTIADSAGGYAALTIMPENYRVLTVEFKINLLAPAKGDFLIAEGKVVKPGRTLFFTNIEVNVFSGNQPTLCATVLQTLISLKPR